MFKLYEASHKLDEHGSTCNIWDVNKDLFLCNLHLHCLTDMLIRSGRRSTVESKAGSKDAHSSSRAYGKPILEQGLIPYKSFDVMISKNVMLDLSNVKVRTRHAGTCIGLLA